MVTKPEVIPAGGLVMPRWAFPLLAILAAVILVGAVAVLRPGEGAAAPAREMAISVQGNQFLGTEPLQHLRVGERVALTIENREPGAVHDFVISGLPVRTGYLQPGESETLVFTPDRPGVYRYSCSLHPGLMDGQVVVR